ALSGLRDMSGPGEHTRPPLPQSPTILPAAPPSGPPVRPPTFPDRLPTRSTAPSPNRCACQAPRSSPARLQVPPPPHPVSGRPAPQTAHEYTAKPDTQLLYRSTQRRADSPLAPKTADTTSRASWGLLPLPRAAPANAPSSAESCSHRTGPCCIPTYSS